MSQNLYQEILEHFQELTPKEQRRLREDSDKILDAQSKGRPKKRHNVMEFKGVAGDFWRGIDIQKYIEEERRS